VIHRFERFASLITVIHRCLNKIMNDEMVKFGLKGTYALYLSAMYRYKDGITAARLCEVCDKNKAAVSRALAEMAELGLIKRENANNSSYRARITLTEKGKFAARYIRARAIIAVEKAGEGLSPDQRRIFYKSLELIATNLQIISEEGLPGE